MQKPRKLKRKTILESSPESSPELNLPKDSVKLRKIKPEKPRKIAKVRKIEKPEPLKKKLKKYYKRQQCAFIRENGQQCKKIAVGKSTLCEMHNGDVVIKENLYRGTEEITHPNVKVKFDPSIHPIAYIEMAKEGFSEVEIAAEFGVSSMLMQDWGEKFESFYIAREVGKTMHEAWWLHQGKDNLNERSFNTNLFKYMTMNKLGYSDKIEQKSLNMNLHGVLMVPDAVSEEDWEKDSIDA